MYTIKENAPKKFYHPAFGKPLETSKLTTEQKAKLVKAKCSWIKESSERTKKKVSS